MYSLIKYLNNGPNSKMVQVHRPAPRYRRPCIRGHRPFGDQIILVHPKTLVQFNFPENL